MLRAKFEILRQPYAAETRAYSSEIVSAELFTVNQGPGCPEFLSKGPDRFLLRNLRVQMQ